MRVNATFQKCFALVVFLIAVLWYFFPVGRDSFNPDVFAMRLALPAAVFTLCGIGMLPLSVTLGFLFCMVGDALGVAGSFEGQMSGFALAQICFITRFISDIRKYMRDDTLGRVKREFPIIATVVCIIPLLLAVLYIFPEVSAIPIRIGCIIYALLLLTSVWTSIVRAFLLKNYIAMSGCLLFLISDSTIAWNKFTEHIPHAGIYIMTSYYAALLFLGTLPDKTNDRLQDI